MFMSKKNVLIAGMLFVLSVSFLGTAEAARELSADYRIKPADTLTISVWGQGNLDATALVDSKGYINYAFVGDIKVVGKTVGEIQEIITEVLNRDYIANPRVYVSIESRPAVIWVIGEVGRPGSYSYEPDLDPLRAVTLAGGFTDFASWTVTIVRKDESGKEIELRCKVKKLRKADPEREKYKLLPGDMLIVKRSWF
jgi:polysaccharide export outer membrane protein